MTSEEAEDEENEEKDVTDPMELEGRHCSPVKKTAVGNHFCCISDKAPFSHIH